jgi:hypothetical protein
MAKFAARRSLHEFFPYPSRWRRMKVKQLIEILERFDPEGTVHVGMNLPGRVYESHEQLWIGDYGAGPQINVGWDFRVFQIYVGCGLEQMVTVLPLHRQIDLGRYDNRTDAARVRDFFVINEHLHEPLNFPDFDYEHWIPPRTTSGEYNPIIAKILREKLLGE